MDAEVKIIQPISVVGIEHIGPYMQIGAKYEMLGDMAKRGEWPAQGALGVYYDDPREVPEEALRSEACLIVPFGFDPGSGSVRAFQIPGGPHAVLRHVGPYSTLGESWGRLLGEELNRLGMEPSGPPFEIYVNSPHDTPEDRLITDIHVPVKS